MKGFNRITNPYPSASGLQIPKSRRWTFYLQFVSLSKMPTILLIAGWRLFFYSNEGKEPTHVHAEKGEMECKFWIDEKQFEIREAFSHGLTPSARREIKKSFISILTT